jgi:hypothetical protein
MEQPVQAVMLDIIVLAELLLQRALLATTAQVAPQLLRVLLEKALQVVLQLQAQQHVQTVLLDIIALAEFLR